MEASDMLDVIHYLFEKDATVNSQEEYDTKNSVRDVIYETVYKRKFAYSTKGSRDFSSNSQAGNPEPFDEFDNYVPNTSNNVKPYVPPTNFNPDSDNPFGSVLREGPLG
jgi:hypothetical protein